MINFTLPVVTGQGTYNVPANSFGKITLVCIIPPASSNPRYDYNMTDPDGFGITGNTNLQGSMTMVSNVPFLNGGTFNILNATVDGTYTVRLYQSTDQR